MRKEEKTPRLGKKALRDAPGCVEAQRTGRVYEKGVCEEELRAAVQKLLSWGCPFLLKDVHETQSNRGARQPPTCKGSVASVAVWLQGGRGVRQWQAPDPG